MTGHGGRRYCPNCRSVVETRVIMSKYSQKLFHGITAKRRQVICGIDDQGTSGCGTRWFTLELPEDDLQGLF